MVLSVADFLRRMHRREDGFTLIELLIVIAILAVLAAIAIPLVVNRIEQARESADQANVAQLQSAVDLYVLDGKTFETADLEQSSGDVNFIKKLREGGYLTKAVESPFASQGYSLKSVNVVGNPNYVVESSYKDSYKWTS